MHKIFLALALGAFAFPAAAQDVGEILHDIIPHEHEHGEYRHHHDEGEGEHREWGDEHHHRHCWVTYDEDGDPVKVCRH
jgi:hypothetical protein